MAKNKIVGRPRIENKKMPVTVKLPPYLIEWSGRQKESRAVLIETALQSYYQIPEYLKPE